MIEQHEIARLERTPIEDVAERLGLHVNRHKALCPFHDDSHPSLTFNTLTNRYRCYVCDAHGGVIDLVRQVRGCGFLDALKWLDGTSSIVTWRSQSAFGFEKGKAVGETKPAETRIRREIKPDLEWLSTLVQPRILNDAARHFLFEERHLDERVIAWCGLSSIAWPAPCWRYGKPFYDAPSLLIPYYDIDGRLMSVQSRYLGNNGVPSVNQSSVCDGESGGTSRPSVKRSGTDLCDLVAERDDKPRFKFPRGSNCHIYGLQILRYLQPGEDLWITEGCSDCWAMLSSGRKAIAIPSATLLKDKDIEPLRGLNLHMFPDQDKPGEKLFLELRERLPQIVRHQLPSGFKDVGEYYVYLFNNRVPENF